jgi:hypothetical protein
MKGQIDAPLLPLVQDFTDAQLSLIKDRAAFGESALSKQSGHLQNTNSKLAAIEFAL